MTMQTSSQYGFEIGVQLPFEQTMDLVKNEFKQRGFGVLTEIDVQRTLKEKIDAEIGRYTILGMCNPNFARLAIQAEPMVGLLLPCNVLVREEQGTVHVSAQSPRTLMGVVGNPMLKPIGDQVQNLVEDAMEAVLEASRN